MRVEIRADLKHPVTRIVMLEICEGGAEPVKTFESQRGQAQKPEQDLEQPWASALWAKCPGTCENSFGLFGDFETFQHEAKPSGGALRDEHRKDVECQGKKFGGYSE